MYRELLTAVLEERMTKESGANDILAPFIKQAAALRADELIKEAILSGSSISYLSKLLNSGAKSVARGSGGVVNLGEHRVQQLAKEFADKRRMNAAIDLLGSTSKNYSNDSMLIRTARILEQLNPANYGTLNTKFKSTAALLPKDQLETILNNQYVKTRAGYIRKDAQHFVPHSSLTPNKVVSGNRYTTGDLHLTGTNDILPKELLREVGNTESAYASLPAPLVDLLSAGEARVPGYAKAAVGRADIIEAIMRKAHEVGAGLPHLGGIPELQSATAAAPGSKEWVRRLLDSGYHIGGDMEELIGGLLGGNNNITPGLV